MTTPTPPRPPTAPSTHGIRIFLDGAPAPIAEYVPPAVFQLDTTHLTDGPHTLRIEATAEGGAHAGRDIPFVVRNGPGIAVSGLEPGQVVRGTRSIIVNAYAGGFVEAWEPIRAETPAPIPTWAWVVCVIAAAWGLFYIAREWVPPARFASTPTYSGWGAAALASRGAARGAPTAPAANRGAELFRVTCATCHQANGEGVAGAFPPLVHDPVVTGSDAAAHAQIVLFGLSGRVINGVTYAAQMPAWGSQLSDDEVAAVVNYERTAWGNSAPSVTPQQVATIRAQHK
jgi:mono/diheme cytochrome c family protein